MMNYRKWVKIFVVGSVGFIVLFSALAIVIDPFFHYHKPLKMLYYPLTGGYERYINDGIIRHFEYDAIITGTSMTENFKSSEAETIFGGKVIKVPFSGGSYYEIDQNIRRAYQYQDLSYVIRGLDLRRFYDDDKLLRDDLGKYPEYLYNDSIIDDVKYFFNKDTIKLCTKILGETIRRGHGGITDFDEYANWNKNFIFSKEEVMLDKDEFKFKSQGESLSPEEIADVEKNISSNVTALAKEHPETTFYYFLTPYSIAYWRDLYLQNNIKKSIEAEKIVIEKILEYPNIKLFTFNLKTDVTTNLNNYKDKTHYGEWINSKILLWMKNGDGLLTKNNYEEYLKQEYSFYSTYPYETLVE